MSEDQNKKEVTVLYRNLTPEIASDIIKLNLSEEAEKTLYGYLTSGANSTGHWWTQLWADRVLYTEWSQETSKKIAAFQNCPKEATVVYTNAVFLKLLGENTSPEEMIEQGLKDLKRPFLRTGEKDMTMWLYAAPWKIRKMRSGVWKY